MEEENLFLTSILLPYGQIWVIMEGAASLPRYLSLRFLQFRPEGQRKPRNKLVL